MQMKVMANGMANSVDPDQTAPSGAVWSGSALFAKHYLSQYLEFLKHKLTSFSTFINSSKFEGGFVTDSSSVDFSFFFASDWSSLAIKAATLGSMSGIDVILPVYCDHNLGNNW